MINEALPEIDFISDCFEREYVGCVHDLLSHPLVRSMENYIQHGDTDCLQHCINVSYNSYLICRRLNLDYAAASRAGLLHDFFLYDWHTNNGEKLHGLSHPRIALQNAGKHFELNRRERDIILKHMWPLTITPPQYPETMVVIMVDKYCALTETVSIRNIKLLYAKIIPQG